MNKSESIKELATALAKFQGEIKNPSNTAVNPFFKSKYSPLDTVLNTVRPILSANGLSIIQAPSTDVDCITITTTLLHNSGEWLEFPPFSLKMDKVTAQGAGSAVSYARRYALSAILGISSEDDDDGNNAEPKKKAPTKEFAISSNMATTLYELGTTKNLDKAKVDKGIKEYYKKNNANELTKKEYDDLVVRLTNIKVGE